MKKHQLLLLLRAITVFSITCCFGFEVYADHLENYNSQGGYRGHSRNLGEFNSGKNAIFGVAYSSTDLVGGKASEKIDLLDYDTRFYTNDNETNEIKLSSETLVRVYLGKRKRLNSVFSLEGRIALERFRIYNRESLSARCFVGLGAEGAIYIDFFDVHVGYAKCSSDYRGAEFFITDTQSPSKNPYHGTIEKIRYGAGFSIRPDKNPKEWTIRFFGSLEQVEIRIRGANKKDQLKATFPIVTGLEYSWWY